MEECANQGVGAGDDVVTSDGVPIAGWYIPAADGSDASAPTVILVHGFTSDKSGDLPYAIGLHEHFNLVAFDERNSGRSGGTQTTAGVLEQNDVRAMVDWVERVKRPDHVGLFGVSMGAAAALAAAGHDPRIEAVALDSMHTRIVYQLEQRLQKHGHPACPGTWATFIGAWLRTGTWLSGVDPADTIAAMDERPIMLTHGTADDEDLPERTQAFFDDALAAGRTIELHWCDGAKHAQVDDVCGDDLAQWLSDFFTRNLAQRGTGQDRRLRTYAAAVRRLHPPTLHAALDAERRERGMTWQQVARESGVSAHTIQRTQRQVRFEVDGILALAGWLGRPIEDFTVDDGTAPS